MLHIIILPDQESQDSMQNSLTQANGGGRIRSDSIHFSSCHDGHWHREDLMNTSVAIPDHMPKFQHYLITPGDSSCLGVQAVTAGVHLGKNTINIRSRCCHLAGNSDVLVLRVASRRWEHPNLMSKD